MISNYDETLNNYSIDQKKLWAKKVFDAFVALDLEKISEKKIIMLAGINYRQYLVDLLEKERWNIECPLAGLSIGRQLQWLNAHTKTPATGFFGLV